jgi:hypothetical protein
VLHAWRCVAVRQPLNVEQPSRRPAYRGEYRGYNVAFGISDHSLLAGGPNRLDVANTISLATMNLSMQLPIFPFLLPNVPNTATLDITGTSRGTNAELTAAPENCLPLAQRRPDTEH